jgi:hypothetical protein
MHHHPQQHVLNNVLAAFSIFISFSFGHRENEIVAMKLQGNLLFQFKLIGWSPEVYAGKGEDVAAGSWLNY